MYRLVDECDYSLWTQHHVLADCFTSLGLPDMASKMSTLPANMTIIANYVAIIKHQAAIQKNNDVLEMLSAHHLMSIGYGEPT